MSDSVNIDVINTLIAGHFTDPFPCWGCTVLNRGSKFGHC